jgi:hypothetical protein
VARGGFNSQLKELTDIGDNVKISVTTFNRLVKIVNWVGTKEDVVPLTEENYKPMGGTAMLDALGTTLLLAQGEWNNQDYNLVVVISDGFENSSRKYSWNDVADTIKDLTATGKWNFAYIGANQNMWEINKNLGIRNTMAWTNDRRGTQVMYAASASGLTESARLASSGQASEQLPGFDFS